MDRYPWYDGFLEDVTSSVPAECALHFVISFLQYFNNFFYKKIYSFVFYFIDKIKGQLK